MTVGTGTGRHPREAQPSNGGAREEQEDHGHVEYREDREKRGNHEEREDRGNRKEREEQEGWGELVAAALLGAERRRPPGGSVTALLDAAATETVRRRAGARPAVPGQRPAHAPADGRPPLPGAAERRLAALLADRAPGGAGAASGRRGAGPDLGELLPQWLAEANAHGYRAPTALLPALLDAARARTDLRAETLAFAGPRALWLARYNADWKFALRDGVRRRAPDGRPDETEKVWQEGLFAERVALLTAVRRRDPDAATALLASTWQTERAEDRLMFLDSLREGLRLSDEPFLERALADRSRTVRATAAELLTALPGSALAARMADRARGCVTPDRTGGSGGIAVTAPSACDADMQRDGIAPKPPSGRGERAWWLGQLVEAAPLEVWGEQLGGATPAEIIALPVADGWRDDLHAAWCGAAVRQRNAPWARALIGEPTDPFAEGPGDPAKLLSVLPEEERGAWAARFVAAHGLSEAFRVLGMCGVPWPLPLGRAVVDALEIARDAGSYPWSFSGVMGLAERCLDPSDTERLAPLAAVPDEKEGESPGAGAYWAESFQRLLATLRLRSVMLAELRNEVPDSGPELPAPNG
ncbi:DUF5691 domain-containing protein [Streptomyces qinglanensis]|uniref:Uncharacterized protein n=1 Tax=Streptomyces qinglanensis TaxID=943816 RepID=A0A1H9VC32_9ACTN|nr:DUF5691 domain-containing protein [Streptomyces qinglanensis]SES19148.1 hypothetical protein SAMN05421870_111138 [Streptomyces qinglanensis]